MPLFVFTVIATVSTLLDDTRTRLDTVRRDDRGATVLEWVLISGTVIILGAIVVAAVTAFVNGRVGQIA